MRKAKPEVAFIAAFLALLVLPLTVAIGLSMLGLVTSMDLTWRDAGWGVLTVFLIWAGLGAGAIVMLIARLIRRIERP